MSSRHFRIARPQLAVLVAASVGASAAAQYRITNLVSDGKIPAAHTDPNLVNPWGIVFNPAGFVWVSDNATWVSTLYNGDGVPQSLVVSVPSAQGPFDGTPTGIVFSGSATDFPVTDGTNTAPARFIFASQDGTISGWAPGVPPPPPSTQAFVTIDDSLELANYTGLALGQTGVGPRLFTVDFYNKRIEAYDGAWADVKLDAGFMDPDLPADYAPFNAAVIDGTVYVAYAKSDGSDEVPGPGLGLVDQFDFDGKLLRRFATGGALNAPWGLAKAPDDFGILGGAILVGNFGDGVVNAYDPVTGDFIRALRDYTGRTIVSEGLWGIAFGNGILSQPLNTLFFAAGPADETQGLYGRIDPLPLGDLNGDGIVDGADLGLLLGDWGPCPVKGLCPGDLNDDGEVDGADLGILLGNWTG